MKTKTLAALAAVLAVLIAGCGSSSSSSSSPEANGADRAFVQQMIPHHQSAVQMAQIGLQRGQSAYVKTLSQDIISSQSKEITEMKQADSRLAADGVKTGSLGVAHSMMGMDMDTESLKTAQPFDSAFIKMMTPHHQGAITMARAELQKGKDPELKELATSIISAQEKEIGQMRAFLARS